MRHGKKFNHLSRTSAHRKAMLANMACSLIEHKRIKTTLAKAKALRVYVEPLITKSKNDTTHSRRTVFSYLKQKDAITELFSDIATRVADREGGYTRILKLSNRLGDHAHIAYIEFVDYNEDYTTDKPTRKKARGAKKKTIDAVTQAAVEEAILVEETVKAVESGVDEVKVDETAVEHVPVAEEVVEEEASATEDTIEEVKAKETVVKEDTQALEEKKEVDGNPENKEQKGE